MIKKIIAVLLVLSMTVLLFSCDGNNEDVTTAPDNYILPTEIIDADITLPYMSTDSFDPYTSKIIKILGHYHLNSPSTTQSFSLHYKYSLFYL